MPLTHILLTGATGSVGAHVLDQLLTTKSYTVSAVIRSLSRSAASLEFKYAPAISSKRLTLLEIPDLTTPHIFDVPASTADAIIHITTPLAYTGDLKAQVIDPTWVIDESILRSAKKSPSVKRIIITGSIVSTMNPFTDLVGNRTITAADYNGSKLEDSTGHYGPAYMYAKTAAEQKAWAFMKQEKPSFDLVVLLAPSITGRCIQGGFKPDKTALGGMANIYNAVFDVKEVGFVFPYFMDVEDVAAIHVTSLDTKMVPGDERYLFHAGVMSGNRIADKVRENYPELRERVPAGADGDGFSNPMAKVDVKRFEEVFGEEWMGWWKSANGTVKDILKYEKTGVIA